VSLENCNSYTRPHLSAAQLIVKIRQSDQKYQVLLALMDCRTKRQDKFIEILLLLGISPKASLPLLRLVWIISLASESQDISYDEKD
jgi:hypothetical protein